MFPGPSPKRPCQAKLPLPAFSSLYPNSCFLAYSTRVLLNRSDSELSVGWDPENTYTAQSPEGGDPAGNGNQRFTRGSPSLAFVPQHLGLLWRDSNEGRDLGWHTCSLAGLF